MAQAPAIVSETAQEITIGELHKQINRPNNLFILDVRNPDEFESWRIEGLYTPETLNIPYFEFFEDQEEVVNRVPYGKEVIVVCAKGGASDFVALVLEEHGRQARNLTDGMIAWGEFYVIRPVVETKAYQIYQVERPARGCLSHVLISEGKAVIIDPLRHIERYKSLLADKDADLELLLDTHAHADHVSGGFALQEEMGAAYYLHPYDGIHPFDMMPAVKPYNMLADGMTFELGELQIRVIHTPGHTLGQVNFLVSAPDGESYLFTGDNIFIESFGRPDLGGQGERWAPVVYETIFGRIKNSVPGQAWVMPGHYARFDEANDDGLFIKRLDDLWVENQGLQHADRDEFIGYVLDQLPKMPQEYIEIKRVNIGLSQPDEAMTSELELGKNICALSDAY
ncbi:MAG: MBL fold metallo-hydrolase [Caldilineales bacterium]|nr:MBL fold metallo-hydrolase [Caldilineales bacterium]